MTSSSLFQHHTLEVLNIYDVIILLYIIVCTAVSNVLVNAVIIPNSLIPRTSCYVLLEAVVMGTVSSKAVS